MMNNIKSVLISFCVLIILCKGVAFGGDKPSNLPDNKPELTVDEIIDRIEKRYGRTGFLAGFEQKSTLKALQITDTAKGKAFFKYPGMMRWEYDTPEKQWIITDGSTLWIHRPDDNQVMIGSASSYFGDGKGASFLSDIKLIRQSFNVAVEKKEGVEHHLLKLWPKEKNFDLSVIYLSISKKRFDVVEVVTYNSYGDKTLIEFSDLSFRPDMDPALFTYEVSDGVDILSLD